MSKLTQVVGKVSTLNGIRVDFLEVTKDEVDKLGNVFELKTFGPEEDAYLFTYAKKDNPSNCFNFIITKPYWNSHTEKEICQLIKTELTENLGCDIIGL